MDSQIKFRRGDLDPVTGKLFWGTYKGKPFFLTPEKFAAYKAAKNLCERRGTGNRARSAAWRKMNPDRARAGFSRWLAKNKAHYNEYQRKYQLERKHRSAIFRLKALVRVMIDRALKTTSGAKVRRSFKIIGCTPAFLKAYIETRFLPGMSWERRGEIHIDHVKPLASAKTTREVLKLCHYTNLQPL